MPYIEHAANVVAGARKFVTTIARLIPNVGEPLQSKRKLLMIVVFSKLLYSI